jgi:hypothetical protein
MSYVYFIRQGRRGPIKIGVADSPQQRLANLQVGNPSELWLIGTKRIAGGWLEAREVELSFQGQFADQWIRGEWFRPTKRLTDAIAEFSDPLPDQIPPDPALPPLSPDERWDAMKQRVLAAVDGDLRGRNPEAVSPPGAAE